MLSSQNSRLKLSEKGYSGVDAGALACMRRPYLTDLSDAEWECIEGLLPTPENEGRPRLHSLREILNAIFYVVRSGCVWRPLPHDFPPWKTVYHYFRFWRLDGTWERMHSSLRQRVRVRMKRDPQPRACLTAHEGNHIINEAMTTIAR